ncbi:MAG TPA: hypothetical protein P5244_13420, partial [Syntrophales bacterium]|nr:hypothetical protein [Syntrophales bacterium]
GGNRNYLTAFLPVTIPLGIQRAELYLLPDSFFVGNATRQIGWMSRYVERLSDKLDCPSCRRRYALHRWT